MVLNGILGGLVGITAGADLMSPTDAILIGLIAGAIIPVSVAHLRSPASIDDPVGATSVHLVCGLWGTLAVGIFGSMAGLEAIVDPTLRYTGDRCLHSSFSRWSV